ncbi:MAG: hypothetical protein NC247_04120 [Ruminococcus flavefaciens]|nr:hypothetical protein [Ruminococcus flavefaciens]
MILDDILMPINEDFVEVFGIFMDEGMVNKVRAQNVRQYIEGIIDLLLKDKIIPLMKENELYEGLTQKKKLAYIDTYDSDISYKIRRIFEIGGKASHFKNKITQEELKEIIELAIHIVEDIFVKYFCEPEHRFGTENIYTIFSMLPLKNRIYILEKLSDTYINSFVVDRLSLAYFKNRDEDKAIDLLNRAYRDAVIDEYFFWCQKRKFQILQQELENVVSMNTDYENDTKIHTRVVKNVMVVGFPTSKNVLDTKKAIEHFTSWVAEGKNKYPEFTKLFLYLMQTDDRQYEKHEA